MAGQRGGPSGITALTFSENQDARIGTIHHLVFRMNNRLMSKKKAQYRNWNAVFCERQSSFFHESIWQWTTSSPNCRSCDTMSRRSVYGTLAGPAHQVYGGRSKLVFHVP